MKLHLPKMLLTAVLAAVMMPASWAADSYWTPDNAGQKLLENNDVLIATGDKVIIGSVGNQDQNIAINGKSTHGGDHANGHYFTVNGELDASGNYLRLESRAKMIIDGGTVTAGSMQLGYAESYAQDIWGALEMRSGTLTTGTITLNQNWSNVIDIKGGTVEFTEATAINRGSNTATTIRITGSGVTGAEGQVTLKSSTTAWTLDGTGLAVAPEIGNVTIDADNTKMITIISAHLIGDITNNAKLTLGGALTVAEDQVVRTFASNGFTYNQLVTVDNFKGTGTYTFSEGMTINGIDFSDFENKDGVYTAEQNVTGTIYHVAKSPFTVDGSASNAAVNATGYEVLSGQTLTITANQSATMTAAKILAETTGEGNITLQTNDPVVMTAAAKAKGKLTIDGSTLTIDVGRDTDHSYLASFSSIDLNGATINYHGSNTTLDDVTVGSGVSTINIKDMGTDRTISLTGTTTLTGNLSILSDGYGSDTNSWKYKVNIQALTGNGNLTVAGTTTQGSPLNQVDVKLLSTYGGIISVNRSMATTKLIATADGDINLGGLNITGGAIVDLSGVAGTKNLGNVSIGANTTLALQGVIGSMRTEGSGMLSLAANTSVIGTTTIGNAVTLEGALSNSGTLTFSTAVDFSNGLTNSGTVNIEAGYSAAGTLTNAGSFNLTGDVTVSNITNLEDTGTVTYSDNNGQDGYITSATYYVVKSQETTDSVTLTGASSLYQGANVIGAITTSGNNLVVTIDNEDAASGLYYVRTKDLEVNGAADNVAVNATGYNVATGRTLTIADNQNDTMTASKILAETTGAGNITLSTDAALDDTSTLATGTLIIDNGAVLTVGNGSNDTSNISSFNAVTLIGSTLNLNGAAQEVKTLTVGQTESDGAGESIETSKSTLIVQNANSSHHTYTLSGTTTLNADLDITSPGEHGSVVIEKLSGSKNLAISGGSADWGGVAVRIETLTDYEGSISVDNGGRASATYAGNPGAGPAFTHVEFSKGAFTTLKGLEVAKNAYALVHASNASTIEALTLKNGTLKLNPYGAYTYALTDVSVGGTGTISLINEAGAGGYQGQINIGSLNNAAGSATSTLNITSANVTTQRSIVNVNGGDFDGTISVTGSNTADSRKIAMNINDATVAKDTEIKLHGNGSHVALGIGANKVTVKGISDAEGASGTMKIVSGAQQYGNANEFGAADSTKRTLEVNTAGGSYTSSATVDMNLNLVKSGSGTQNFSGDMSAFNGTVEVSGGTLGFTKADGSVTVSSLTLSGGKLDVTNSLTLNTVTINLTQYTAGENIDDLVAAGTLISGENYSVSYVGGVTTVGSYTGTVEKVDNRLVLTWSDLTPEKTSLTTTISGVYGLFDSVNNMLTLNIDEKDSLANVGDVTISGISDDIMKDILGLTGLPTDGMVGITLRDKDGVEFTATADQVVGFQGKDGVYYGAAGTGNVGWVYQAAYIPEPTTTTLSLLALAGLAMRRRRKA